MASYTEQYRTGMQQNYSQVLRQMLQSTKQREGLGGRALSPAERAAMIQGVLMPFTSSYSRGVIAAREKEEEDRRYKEMEDLQEAQLKQQEEAAEIAGYTQLASIGVGGAGQYAMSGGGGSGGGGGGGGSGGGGGTSSSAYGNVVAGVGGAMVGYQVSPYGQKIEEGIGNPNAYVVKAFGGGHSRRTGQRMSMVATGAGGGYIATGGNPYGAAGGAIGGYFQENPETGKTGYQEDWEYRIQPLGNAIYQKTYHVGEEVIKEPAKVEKKVRKAVKKILGF